jgi:hypothetical protein
VNIGEFFVRLGVDAETVKVKDFVSSIGELPVKAAAGIAALAGISLSIVHMANDAMDAVVAFGAFEAQTGLSAQELQKWQRVAVQANVSAETVTSSVSSLQRQLADIRMGRGNISPFQILGIDPRQDAFQVIDQLRARIKGMDRPTATNLISQMGLTPDMMQVLTLSDAKFKEFGRTVTGMSPKAIQEFAKLKLELNKLKLEIHDLMFKAIASLLPILNPIVHSVFPAMVSALSRISGEFSDLARGISGFKGELLGIGLILGALAISFAPVTIGATLLYLILDDLVVWAKGGKSVFGDAFSSLKTIFDSPIESIKVLLGLLDELFKKMKTPGDDVDAAMKTIFSNPATSGQVLLDLFKEGLKGGALNAMLGLPSMPAFLGAGGNVTQTNNITMQIHSTAPASEVGKHAAKRIAQEINDASLQIGNSEGTRR